MNHFRQKLLSLVQCTRSVRYIRDNLFYIRFDFYRTKRGKFTNIFSTKMP